MPFFERLRAGMTNFNKSRFALLRNVRRARSLLEHRI
jgi:hypothetical protein